MRTIEGRTGRKGQGGFTLLEGMVAILVFSFGVLALVGLQVTSIQQSSNAKYRSEASLLANQLIGTMWVGNRNPTAMQTAYNTGGAGYNTWLGNVQAALPGSAASAPTVVVAADGMVTVTMFWKAPNEPASDPMHSYVAVAQLR